MRKEEFIKELNRLGFKAIKGLDVLYIFAGDEYVGKIIDGERYQLDCSYVEFSNLESDEQLALLDLMVEYAKTPLDERVNLKKYKLMWNADIATMLENDDELVLNELNNRFYFVKPWENLQFKRKFTEEEISNFPQKIKRLITLEYLILVEVD